MQEISTSGLVTAGRTFHNRTRTAVRSGANWMSLVEPGCRRWVDPALPAAAPSPATAVTLINNVGVFGVDGHA